MPEKWETVILLKPNKAMKNIIFLLAIISLASCKKHHDEVKPVSKTDSLHVVFTGDNSSQLKTTLYLNGSNTTVWHGYPALYTHTVFSLDTIFTGGQTIQFGAQSTLVNGDQVVYGTYHIKITYGKSVLCDKAFSPYMGYPAVYCNADLPFIK